MVALRELSKTVPCRSKSGVEITAKYSPGLYAAFFYTDGLARAQEIYRLVRAAVDADPVLGSTVAMKIKRACTEFEMALGPSDKFEIRADLAPFEASVDTLLHPRDRKPPEHDHAREINTLWDWIETAFRIGDETYKDFSNGEKLYPETVSYPTGGDLTQGEARQTGT